MSSARVSEIEDQIADLECAIGDLEWEIEEARSEIRRLTDELAELEEDDPEEFPESEWQDLLQTVEWARDPRMTVWDYRDVERILFEMVLDRTSTTRYTRLVQELVEAVQIGSDHEIQRLLGEIEHEL